MLTVFFRDFGVQKTEVCPLVDRCRQENKRKKLNFLHRVQGSLSPAGGSRGEQPIGNFPLHFLPGCRGRIFTAKIHH